MLDLKIIRQNTELVKDVIKKRNIKNLNLDDFLSVDKEKLDLLLKVDELRAIKNKVSDEIPKLKDEEKNIKISEMKKLWEELKILEERQKEVEQNWENIYYKIPNILSETTAIWDDEDSNVVESKFLEPTKFDFEPKTHYEIWEKKWWIDIEKWSEISWSRFWYLKWDLVFLQFAIVNYAISKLASKWFNPILPPVLVKEPAMFGTWFFPAWEDGIYSVNPWEDDLFLVWTAEVPVTSYHSGEILDLENPIKYVWYSACFRREAWSAWKDTRWILRWHQFDKVEMVVFCKPEDSKKMHNQMIEIEEEVWKWLWIPFQKLNICSGDLWNPAMKKYDLEAWMPWENKYREVTSCSNVWEYQSRRLWIRYKDESWKNTYVHTLNWTVVALWRCLIAIIENYQDKNWDVIIPEVLRPFMWDREKI